MTLTHSRSSALGWGLAISFFALSSLAAPHTPSTEVYQDEHVTIHAAVAGVEGQILHFGDVLTLVMEVVPHSSGLELREPDGDDFTDAWPESATIHLLDHWTSVDSASGRTAEVTRVVYDFQILACPDGEALCRGTRRYEFPELTLRYQAIDEAGEVIGKQVVQFRPWPEGLMISSALPLGKNDALFPFTTYFPAGAYPDGLPGKQGHIALGLIAGGIVASLGGVLLLPLKFGMRSRLRVKPIPRWQHLLEQLQAGEVEGDQRFFDTLRRCLVWYCVDELAVDPFAWLERTDEASGEAADEKLSAYRSLFLDLLHHRHEQREALLEQLSDLVSREDRSNTATVAP